MGKVGRQCDQARVALELAQLEVRRPHLDAQGLGLVTAGESRPNKKEHLSEFNSH
jgi:hypothetical protein